MRETRHGGQQGGRISRVERGGGVRESARKDVREGVNVRPVRTMTSGYRLILIMESVQVKRSIFPPAHVHSLAALPRLFVRFNPLLPCRAPICSPSPLHFGPALRVLRAPAISISRHLSIPPRPPAPFSPSRSAPVAL